MGDRNAVPALIRALERGNLSKEVASALAHFRDPRTNDPLLEFLKKRGKAFPEGMSDLLDLAVKLRMRDALPTIRVILATPSKLSINQARHDMLCGRALVLLGDPSGIPVLIPLLDPGSDNGWLAAWSGEALNAITGQSFWREGHSGARVKADYEAWWKAHRGRLEWDEIRRAFEVK